MILRKQDYLRQPGRDCARISRIHIQVVTSLCLVASACRFVLADVDMCAGADTSYGTKVDFVTGTGVDSICQ